MLKISSEQIRAFQPDADEAFVRRVSDYLRKNHAETQVHYPQGATTVAEIGDDALAENVRGGILRASDYGINLKSTLLSYVVLMFMSAPNFDEYPKAAQFFKDAEVIDDEALETFLDEMTDEDWSKVEANYNAAAWSLPLAAGVAI
ncbi:MAG TPA: hypothetical protein VGC97_00715 [Pyrinomonadaceae bacterium]|jgi:hypothetical protein